MRVEKLKDELRRKETELQACEFELVKIDVQLHRTSAELAEANRKWLHAMDEKPRDRDIGKAEKLRLNAVQIQSTLSSDDKQACLNNKRNLQREIIHLKQEVQRAEREQQRDSACSTSFCR